ncbi:coagulation factor IXb isoform X1 [Neolamprologus brichardi]|uniref:Coagulation factor IX n=1 Tax=Neolamprologus brichardi TaxID=32507 RepID=A0A3Q4GPX1_NEOBR|nr:coagulation factor IXb isoform X1 [Neolamprologus brichardi]
MARVCALVCFAGFLLDMHGVGAEITEENTGAVFVSQQTADTVLHRKRRYNTPFEEFKQGNLERECIEEICSMEEAREVFEDDEKTMEFWAGYVDGDQCKPPPCQNGGVCKDGINSYLCLCQPNFSGKNCEIEVNKQCLVNNGECSHFCVMKANQAVCRCATGYILGPNKKSCEPIEPFSCGRVNLSSSSLTRSILEPRSSNFSYNDTRNDYFYDEDISEYDYLNHPMTDSNPSNDSLDSEAVIGSRHVRSVTDTPKTKTEMLSWGYATLPNVTTQEKTDQRIVGGDTAIPGEIPWQVALMFRPDSAQRARPFCGGSLLADLWVITAAHCLWNSDGTEHKFFIRVGEHDVNQDEGPERDHEVVERHPHHMYNFKTSPYNHDIALLKLGSPVDLSNKRRPICLGPKDFIQNILRESTVSLVSGWGRIRFQGPEATKLQKLEVPYVDRTKCKQSSRDHITRFMFCAGFESEQKDSCQGDSGGPHATNYKGTWFLTGIISWGEECAKDGKYGVYTRVSHYYKWISNVTQINMDN